MTRRVYYQMILLALLISPILKAQEIDSITMTQENGRLGLEYDFVQNDSNVPYELYLYSSHDNFTKPLQMVSGDIGKNVYPGLNKKIIWEGARELGNFKGEVILKIKGSVYKPFVTYVNVPDRLTIKRGSIYTFEWSYDKKPEKLMLKILRNGVPVADSKIIDNLGKYVWSVPKNIPPGKGYSLQLSDTENLIREESSHAFRIKRKVPLGFIAVPAALIGSAAVILFLPENVIPEPPSAPTN
ncbi:MAG: hypothetical protein U5K79_09525 [Cyclobacteriaceae bacterium]|nr:hypothetical protein [Cyclobacteriaceae bacterium]